MCTADCSKIHSAARKGCPLRHLACLIFATTVLGQSSETCPQAS